MIDDLKAMAIFAETIKRGSFRAAAVALDLSPSVVSYQITKLEERLGSALIYRSTRKLSMTAEGETLFNHATQMMDQAELGIRTVSGHDHATGRLNITLPLSMSGDILTHQLAVFARENPGIDCHFIFDDNRLDLVAEGIDIAFSLGSLPDSALNVKRLGTRGRTLVCSPDYLAKHETPTHPNDLKGWSWIKHDILPGSRTLIKGNERIDTNLIGNIAANSSVAMVEFTVAGLGLCTAGDWLIEDHLRDGRLIRILTDWKVEDMPLYAVWHGNISKCSNTRRLLNFLADYDR